MLSLQINKGFRYPYIFSNDKLKKRMTVEQIINNNALKNRSLLFFNMGPHSIINIINVAASIDKM